MLQNGPVRTKRLDGCSNKLTTNAKNVSRTLGDMSVALHKGTLGHTIKQRESDMIKFDQILSWGLPGGSLQ